MSVFVGIVLGTLGISVMQLVLATSLPSIFAEIGGAHLYGWVFASYMLASLLTIPVFSKLADLYGKRKFYLLGMGFFAAGTLYGGLAPAMEHLIVARVIQGLGAGMMIPVSLALISDTFSGERRGHMIGAFSLVQLLAILLSPFLGSLITKELGWQWIFFLAFGVILLAMLLVAASKQVPQPLSRRGWKEVDLVGGVLFGAFCVLVVSFSDAVSEQGRLALSHIWLLGGAVAAAAVLAWNERRHKDPVIKVVYFRTKILRRSIISSMIAGGIMYGLVTILPLSSALLGREGFAIDESKILLLFLLGTTVGLLIGSRLVSRLKSGFPRVLWGVSVASAAVMYFAMGNSSPVMFSVLTGFLGLCLGGIMATLLINSQNAVSSEDRTVLSGLVQLARYLGAAVGVTILTGMLPDVGQISGTVEFVGAFSALVGLYVLGLANELI